MSVYATILHIQHPEELDQDSTSSGATVIRTQENYEEEASLGSPWAYQDSHIIPSDYDPRQGSVELGAIPSFVADYRQGKGEEEAREGWLGWLRLWVGQTGLAPEEKNATVVIDAAQAAKIREAARGPVLVHPEAGRLDDAKVDKLALSFGACNIPLSPAGPTVSDRKPHHNRRPRC